MDTPSNENAKIIIALLDKNAADMDVLKHEVHDNGRKIDGISVYFAGIEPQVHILDHAKVREMLDDKKDIQRATRNAAWSVMGSVLTAVALAVGAWILGAAQADLKAQIVEVLQNQKSTR